jgi:hypothetical protein
MCWSKVLKEIENWPKNHRSKYQNFGRLAAALKVSATFPTTPLTFFSLW